MIAYGALLDALRGVTWPARRTVHGHSAGAHRSPMRGVSPEFTEYRPYRQGDDPRRLDWKLLARTDRAYLRITNDRASLGTLLLVDASASMSFGDKWTQARRITVGLAAVAHASGDPVGVIAVGARGLAELPPRTRRGVVGEIARLLDDVQPSGAAPLAPSLIRAHAARRVAIVSDFLGDHEDILAAARVWLAEKGEAVAVHIVAREELEPRAESAIAVDPEESAVRRPLTRGAIAAYERDFADFRDRLARVWRDAGGAYALAMSDEPADRVVRRVTGLATALAT